MTTNVSSVGKVQAPTQTDVTPVPPVTEAVGEIEKPVNGKRSHKTKTADMTPVGINAPPTQPEPGAAHFPQYDSTHQEAKVPGPNPHSLVEMSPGITATPVATQDPFDDDESFNVDQDFVEKVGVEPLQINSRSVNALTPMTG